MYPTVIRSCELSLHRHSLSRCPCTSDTTETRRTRLLQPSLSGDALISVICTLSPASANLNESLSTLSFAQGLKRVVLRAQRKEMMDPQALIQQYQEEIAELRSMLQNKQMDNGSGTGGTAAQDKRGKGNDQSDMEDRLIQLKSLILHGGGLGGSVGPSQEVSHRIQDAPLQGSEKLTPRLDRSAQHACIRPVWVTTRRPHR